MHIPARTRFEILVLISLTCLALAVLGGLLWANAVYLRHAPPEPSFLVPWLGARTFLRSGESPYSGATAQQIQLWHYDRLAQEGKDPLRVTTPFFFLILYFPFALLSNYTLACNLWMVLNEIALGVLAMLLLRLPGWKLRRWPLLGFYLVVFLWPHTWLGLLGGGAQIFATLATIGALLTLKAGGKDEFAGMLAVLALWQPSISGPLVLFLFLWALAHRRWGMLWGFLMLSSILVLLAFFLLPDWFFPWLRNVLLEQAYSPDWRPVHFLTSWLPGPGKRLAWLLTISAGLLLAVEWSLARRQDLRHLLWVSALTLAMTPLLGMRTSLAGQTALLFALTLIVFLAGQRWGHLHRPWLPYGLMLTVFLGFWLVIGRLSATGDWQALQAWLFWGLPVFSIVGLYWLRWYAFRLPPIWLEEEL